VFEDGFFDGAVGGGDEVGGAGFEFEALLLGGLGVERGADDFASDLGGFIFVFGVGVVAVFVKNDE
jgi:hypothetical protein